MTLNNFVDFSKTHGRSSARFLTNYRGKDIYVGYSDGTKGRMIGYPLLMMERQNKIIALSHDEINKVLASMPDDE